MVYHDIRVGSGKKVNVGKETIALTFTSRADVWFRSRILLALLACSL